ncbi:MAG TPA: hypothetical protein VI299_26140, partial [Polyangiales bacterium]
MKGSAGNVNLNQDWLSQRDYPDLDPRAERALRAAGLSFQNDVEAERSLAEAYTFAPDHMAVAIAHYRYYLYKHKFAEAEGYASECLKRAAAGLSLPLDYEAVRPEHADFSRLDKDVRFWLFALQAYGYVLLRCGREPEALAALRHLCELDRTDQTKTRVL